MKIFSQLLVLNTFLLCSVHGQEYFNIKENQHRNNLVIVHPTLSNLERYLFLIERGILDPGKNKLVGLYFEAENYDYSQVIKDFPEIGFHEIPGLIALNDIFSINAASEEFKKVFQYSNGIIFNGGPDLPPSIYGEGMSTLTVVTDPFRHYIETSFLFHLIGSSRNEELEPFLRKRPKYTILGICLGMQTMNVAAGGDLIQDIPDEVYGLSVVEEIVSQDEDSQHKNYYADMKLHPEIKSYFLHRIKIIPGRWLHKELKYKRNPEPFVFSSHHQSIDVLGKDLRSAATSMDGRIIEAIEHTRYPNVFGIQFHPEVDYLYKTDKQIKFAPGDENFSLKEELIRRESLDFHLKLWEMFGGKL